MKKKIETKTTTITQARPYDSMENAKVDADQYVRLPDVFARKAPVPAQWGISVKVAKASVIKGNPPEVKHQLALVLDVQGAPDKIRLWDEECTKMFAVKSGSDHISKQMGARYLASKKVKNG